MLADTKSKSYALPGASGASAQHWAELVNHLRGLTAIKGQASLHPDARTCYTQWYQRIEREANDHRAVEVVSAFDTRLAVTAVKYALLIELTSTGHLSVSATAMKEAIVLTDYLRATIRHLLDTEFGNGEGDRRLTRVLNVIRKAPGCRKKHLLQQTGYKAKDLDELLGTLKQREDIEESEGEFYPCEG